MTIMTWKLRRPLVWDATCQPRTKFLRHFTFLVRRVVQGRLLQVLKRRKYNNVIIGYVFEQFGIEPLVPWGPSAHLVFRDILKHMVYVSRDQRAGLFFCQIISIAIQRSNASKLLGTFPVDFDADEICDK